MALPPTPSYRISPLQQRQLLAAAFAMVKVRSPEPDLASGALADRPFPSPSRPSPSLSPARFSPTNLPQYRSRTLDYVRLRSRRRDRPRLRQPLGHLRTRWATFRQRRAREDVRLCSLMRYLPTAHHTTEEERASLARFPVFISVEFLLDPRSSSPREFGGPFYRCSIGFEPHFLGHLSSEHPRSVSTRSSSSSSRCGPARVRHGKRQRFCIAGLSAAMEGR